MDDDEKSVQTEDTKGEIIKGGYITVTSKPPRDQTTEGNWGTAVPSDEPSQPSQPSASTPESEE